MTRKLSPTTFREHLFVKLQSVGAPHLTYRAVVQRVRSAFACRVILVNYERRVSGGSILYIGMKVPNASKHLF